MQLPQDFLNRISDEWLPVWRQKYEAGFSESVNSIRVHSHKAKDNNLSRTVPWSEFGYYLNERPNYTWDPHFQSGQYYVQEAASMFLEPIFKAWREKYPIENLKVLDSCAAPGGKSTHLLSLLHPEYDVLLANEPISKRNKVLQENLVKWGYLNFGVSQLNFEEPNQIPEAYFDCILVDAPCSGEGMFRKDEIAIKEWSLDNVKHCALRQIEILDEVAANLKPGGLLIYSTCTFNTEENENQVQRLLNSGFSLFTINDNFPQLLKGSNDLGFRFIPGLTDTEGLYMVGLIKDGIPENSAQKKRFKRLNTAKIPAELVPPPFATCFHHKDQAFVTTKCAAEMFESLNIPFTRLGLKVSQLKGKIMQMTNEFAYSPFLDSKLPVFNMNTQEYVAYMRGESFSNPSKSLGIHVMQYQNCRLGLAKGVKGRWNNMREKNQRIISAPPEKIPSVFSEPGYLG